MKKLITMLSALIITSSMSPLTVACSKKESIDIDKITSDMIINWKNEYKFTSMSGTINATSSKLGSLENLYIKLIIQDNISQIVFTKITGIDKEKLNDQAIDLSKFSDAEIKDYVLFLLLIVNLKLLSIKVEVENEPNSKKFTASIEKTKWDEANENDKLKNEIDKLKKEAKIFLDKSDDEKKASASKALNIQTNELEKFVKETVKKNEAINQIGIDSVKSMYDLIKGTNATIKIDLTSKQ